VTGFVYRCQILRHPGFMVAIYMVMMNPFGVHEFQPTMSTCMVLFLQDFCRCPIVKLAVPFRSVAHISVERRLLAFVHDVLILARRYVREGLIDQPNRTSSNKLTGGHDLLQD